MSCQLSFFNPEVGKIETLWKSSVSVPREKNNWFNLFPGEGGTWIFLEEHFPGKRRNKTIGKDRREFQQSFENHQAGGKKKNPLENEFLSQAAPSAKAEQEK